MGEKGNTFGTETGHGDLPRRSAGLMSKLLGGGDKTSAGLADKALTLGAGDKTTAEYTGKGLELMGKTDIGGPDVKGSELDAVDKASAGLPEPRDHGRP